MKFLILFLLFGSSALAKEPKSIQPIRQICENKVSAGKKWRYCAYEYDNSSRKILYYFHGINGSAKSWTLYDLEQGIMKRWVERGLQPPIVVSISFGGQWLLVEKNSSPKSGLYEIFTQELMPYVQQRLGFVSEENLLMGVSMGGFNASQLYFKDGAMFSRAALICGAMSKVSPFESKEEIQKYKDRNDASSFLVNMSTGISRSYMPTLSDWNRHSPLVLAMHGFSRESIPLYVSNGTGDGFGFDEGNKIFVFFAAWKGAPVKFNFYGGRGHCDVDPIPIADFLMPL